MLPHQVLRLVSRSAAQGCVGFATVVAEAQEPTVEASPTTDVASEALTRDETRARERNWYGWQVLATSGTAAVGLSVCMWKALDGKDVPEALYEPLLGLYVGGGPTVHWAHGEGEKGLASLGFNVGLPFAALALGVLLTMIEYQVKDECDLGLAENLYNRPTCQWYRVTPYLLTASFLAAPVIDASFLAYSQPKSSHSAFAVAPLVSNNVPGRTALVGWMSTWTFSP